MSRPKKGVADTRNIAEVVEEQIQAVSATALANGATPAYCERFVQFARKRMSDWTQRADADFEKQTVKTEVQFIKGEAHRHAIGCNELLAERVMNKLENDLNIKDVETRKKQGDPTLVLAAIQTGGPDNAVIVLQNISTATKETYPDIVKAAVIKNGLALEFAPDQSKQDVEICTAACSNNGLALKYVEIKGNPTVCAAACSNNGLALEYVEKKDDFDVCVAACRQNLDAIQFVSMALRNARDFVNAAFAGASNQTKLDNLSNLPGQLQANIIEDEPALAVLYCKRELGEHYMIAQEVQLGLKKYATCTDAEKLDFRVAMRAVLADPTQLKDVSETHPQYEQIVVAAVNKNGKALRFASEKCRNDINIVAVACVQNQEALEFASPAVIGYISSADILELGPDGRGWNPINLAREKLDDQMPLRTLPLPPAERRGATNAAIEARIHKEYGKFWFTVSGINLRKKTYSTCTDTEKRDKRVALAAIQTQGPELLWSVPHETTGYIELAKEAVRKNPDVYERASPAAKRDIAVVHAMCLARASAIELVSEDVIRRYIDSLQSGTTQLTNAERTLKAYVELYYFQDHFDATLYTNAEPSVREDKKVTTTAVKHDTMLLLHASKSLQTDTDVVRAAAGGDKKSAAKLVDAFSSGKGYSPTGAAYSFAERTLKTFATKKAEAAAKAAGAQRVANDKKEAKYTATLPSNQQNLKRKKRTPGGSVDQCLAIVKRPVPETVVVDEINTILDKLTKTFRRCPDDRFSAAVAECRTAIHDYKPSVQSQDSSERASGFDVAQNIETEKKRLSDFARALGIGSEKTADEIMKAHKTFGKTFGYLPNQSTDRARMPTPVEFIQIKVTDKHKIIMNAKQLNPRMKVTDVPFINNGDILLASKSADNPEEYVVRNWSELERQAALNRLKKLMVDLANRNHRVKPASKKDEARKLKPSPTSKSEPAFGGLLNKKAWAVWESNLKKVDERQKKQRVLKDAIPYWAARAGNVFESESERNLKTAEEKQRMLKAVVPYWAARTGNVFESDSERNLKKAASKGGAAPKFKPKRKTTPTSESGPASKEDATERFSTAVFRLNAYILGSKKIKTTGKLAVAWVEAGLGVTRVPDSRTSISRLPADLFRNNPFPPDKKYTKCRLLLQTASIDGAFAGFDKTVDDYFLARMRMIAYAFAKYTVASSPQRQSVLKNYVATITSGTQSADDAPGNWMIKEHVSTDDRERLRAYGLEHWQQICNALCGFAETSDLVVAPGFDMAVERCEKMVALSHEFKQMLENITLKLRGTDVSPDDYTWFAALYFSLKDRKHIIQTVLGANTSVVSTVLSIAFVPPTFKVGGDAIELTATRVSIEGADAFKVVGNPSKYTGMYTKVSGDRDNEYINNGNGDVGEMRIHLSNTFDFKFWSNMCTSVPFWQLSRKMSKKGGRSYYSPIATSDRSDCCKRALLQMWLAKQPVEIRTLCAPETKVQAFLDLENGGRDVPWFRRYLESIRGDTSPDDMNRLKQCAYYLSVMASLTQERQRLFFVKTLAGKPSNTDTGKGGGGAKSRNQSRSASDSNTVTGKGGGGAKSRKQISSASASDKKHAVYEKSAKELIELTGTAEEITTACVTLFGFDASNSTGTVQRGSRMDLLRAFGHIAFSTTGRGREWLMYYNAFRQWFGTDACRGLRDMPDKTLLPLLEFMRTRDRIAEFAAEIKIPTPNDVPNVFARMPQKSYVDLRAYLVRAERELKGELLRDLKWIFGPKQKTEQVHRLMAVLPPQGYTARRKKIEDTLCIYFDANAIAKIVRLNEEAGKCRSFVTLPDSLEIVDPEQDNRQAEKHIFDRTVT